MCGEHIANDDRFKLIEKYRQRLILGTNIASSEDEMKVIDSILYRIWQMGWIDKMEKADSMERILLENGNCNTCAASKSCKYRPGWGECIRINCPFYESERDCILENAFKRREGLIVNGKTLRGYRLEDLDLIAEIMEEKNMSAEAVTEMLKDAGRVAMECTAEMTEIVQRELEKVDKRLDDIMEKMRRAKNDTGRSAGSLGPAPRR